VSGPSRAERERAAAEILAALGTPATPEEIARQLERDAARIDKALAAQTTTDDQPDHGEAAGDG
jgi:hypothetical protein